MKSPRPCVPTTFVFLVSLATVLAALAIGSLLWGQTGVAADQSTHAAPQNSVSLFLPNVSVLGGVSGTTTPTVTPTATPTATGEPTPTVPPTGMPPVPNIPVAVGAGSSHSCALTLAGNVKCWGSNGFGKLGDGTTDMRFTPVDVVGLDFDVAAISLGRNHTCALTFGGGVKCWGMNLYGQLGDGTTTNRSTPVGVTGLTSGVVAVSAGDEHTCALTETNGVRCWGRNHLGQLGDGTTITRVVPVDVTGLTSGVIAVSAGGEHTCAVTSSGGVKCWGHNTSGELGDGTFTDRLEPVDVSNLTSGAEQVSAGFRFSCARTTAGGVKCWGQGGFGQLGDGTTANRALPVNVTGLAASVVAVSAGYSHTCALTTGGGVKCWGRNDVGQLGDGTVIDRSIPGDVSGLSAGVTMLATAWHTCAVTDTGTVKCWGFNTNGQVGDGTDVNRNVPVEVVWP